MSKRPGLFVSAFVCFCTVRAEADPIEFTIELTSDQEVPAPVDPGAARGQATVTVDPDTNTVSVSGSYENMSSPVVAAHIHGPAPVGTPASVIIPIGTTGGVAGDIVLVPTPTTAENVQTILDGLAYVNVHTENNRPGEIRGQIVRSAEEPKVPVLTIWGGAACALLLAAGAFVAMRRARPRTA